LQQEYFYFPAKTEVSRSPGSYFYKRMLDF